MSEVAGGWFYISQGETKGPFSRAEMAALIRAGVVDEHTKVWNSDMSDWTVLHLTGLRDLLDGKQISPPPIVLDDKPPVRSGSGATPNMPKSPSRPVSVRPLQNTEGLAKLLTTLIYGTAVLGFIYTGKVVRAENRYATLLEMEAGVWMWMSGLLALVTMVVFLVWKYRATSNLVAIHGPQSVTPAGAVYWYFVPVAWFWKPYEAMRNLVHGFKAAEAHNLNLWWGSFLALWGVMLIFAMMVPDVVTTAQEANHYVVFSLLGNVVEFFWCIFGAALVRDISAAETDHMRANVGEREFA